MSPVPWPLIGRTRRKPTPTPAPPAVHYPPEQPMPVNPPPRTIPPPPDARTEHAAQRAVHAWLRREEDVVLPRLAHLTEQHGPWDAAMRMFADDDPKEPR